MNRLTEDVRYIIELIRTEDDSRELYTLDAAKTDSVKLPTFGGRDDEDFVKFKVEVEEAFVQNRVSKSTKLKKLREVLTGQAKKLVPESLVGDIEKAWDVLDKAFGDPRRLMNYKKEALSRLGKLPSRGGRKAQVAWYLEVESLVKDILELGKKSSPLEKLAFNLDNIDVIIRMFPIHQERRLMKCEGEGRSQIEAILKEISEFREEAQRFQLLEENPATTNAPARGKAAITGWSDGYQYDEEDCFDDYGASGVQVNINKQIEGFVAYKPPRRDEECRICKTLEASGDTSELYDDHLHNYPTGCPRYIAMDVNERLTIAMSAKFCLWCHDPEYIFKSRDWDHINNKCPIVVRGKGKFSCKVDSCNQHMWVCLRHKKENLKGLLKFKDDIQSQYKLEFGFTVTALKMNAPSILRSTFGGKKKLKPPGKQKSSLSPRKLKEARRKESVTEVIKKTNSEPSFDLQEINPNVDSSKAALQNSARSLSTHQALKKLKKKMSASGVKQQLRPVPKGRAQFVIGYTKGKTRGLLTLYDTGCGSVLFREGVPQHELGMSVLKNKGPYIVKGVGDTTVKVNDEYMCSVSLNDGTRQVLEGWTVDKITATLTTVNMTLAEAEIKASLKDNEELQSLKCHQTIGGQCGILLGILYNSIFPFT